MRHFLVIPALLIASLASEAQTSGPVILSAGNVNPSPLAVAPGEVLTLFVQPAGTSVLTLSNVTASYSDEAMPVLRVDPASVACPEVATSDCSNVFAVTVQVPLDIPTVCNVCANSVAQAGTITLTVDGVKTPAVPAQPLANRVHIVTACDVSIAGASLPPSFGGLPCNPMITHGDGILVSQSRPAKIGEELVAYATGLGQTNPSLTTGQPAAASSPTDTTFAIDFNYHPNALAARPLPASVTGFAPVFIGATKGYVGLYQINFVVPPAPLGTLPCVDASSATIINGNVIQSNLTVSVGSVFSFDGAGICVATVAVDPPSGS